MTISKEAVEAALVAFLKEKSAQMGEAWYSDMWEEYKRDNAEGFDEEMAQMRCAITALLQTGEVVVKSEVDYMKMRLAQIASGDYKACGVSAEKCAADALIHGKLPAQKEGV